MNRQGLDIDNALDETTGNIHKAEVMTVYKSNKAFKFRIYPNTEQTMLFAKIFGCVRFIYNKMFGDKLAHYEATNEMLWTTPA